MDTIKTEDFLKDIVYLFRETFEGSPEGQGSAYLDRGTGFFSTLEALSAEAVSKDINGTTIAAQTEHAKFYLDRVADMMKGKTEPIKWEQSWLIETVNEQEWDALRMTVRRTYEDVLATLASVYPSWMASRMAPMEAMRVE